MNKLEDKTIFNCIYTKSKMKIPHITRPDCVSVSDDFFLIPFLSLPKKMSKINL